MLMIPIPQVPTISTKQKSDRILQILQYIVFVSIILYFGKAFFIPLAFSLLISFILYPICKWLETKQIPRGLSIFICVLGLTLLMGGLIFLLFLQFLSFSQEWIIIQAKLIETVNQASLYIAEQFGLSAEGQSAIIKKLMNDAATKSFSLIQGMVSSFTDALFSLILIPLLSILILYYRGLLANALYHFFPLEQRGEIHEILTETIQTYYNFIKGMSVVYLIVGVLNSIGLAIIGVPHPVLFGVIASVLTFIPYVGIMLASILPITIAWISYNSIWYPISVIAVFSFVQLLEAYIIFPFAVGSSLKINTLTIIVMIILGGIIWGGAGMILFIPFISIVKLIADKSDNLIVLSSLLGEEKQFKVK